MPRQAGYWIESYATKIAAPVAGGGLNVILQAKRGNSRPDVILQFENTEIAWLDITSSASEGHIYDKDHDGWLGTPYVTEVTYSPLKLTELKLVSVPDVFTMDISGLLSAAKEANEKQLNWEGTVVENYGQYFGTLMQKAYYYAKESAVKHYEDGISRDSELEKLFSPDEPGNKFEKLALALVEGKSVKQPDARELTAVIMYWNGMISRYDKRFVKKLPREFYVPSKEQLGLSWVKDISSADGEPIVREWFPV